jgi:hypothetical protein
MSFEPPRSHFVPRTRDGRRATLAFVVLFALCMPPFSHTVWNRMEPVFAGLPFFWTALFALYLLMIVVLIRAFRAGV